MSKGLVANISVRILVLGDDEESCSLDCRFMFPHPITEGNPVPGIMPGREGIGMQCVLFGKFLGVQKRDQLTLSRSEECLKAFPNP